MSCPISVTVSCPGRICFAGEYLDWLLGPAILGAITLRVCINVQSLPKHYGHISIHSCKPLLCEQRISLSDIGNYTNCEMDLIHAAVKVVFDKGVQVQPIQITASTALPVSAGLSSSAAVSVATVAALSKLFDLKLSTPEICALAHLTESEELKTGAGQMDFYACGFGGLLYIDASNIPPEPIQQFRFPSDLQILIADTEIRRSTKNVFRLIYNRHLQSDPLIISYVAQTEKAVNKLRGIFDKGESIDTHEMGVTISNCHEYLRKFMLVSTDLLNRCSDLLEEWSNWSKINRFRNGRVHVCSSSAGKNRSSKKVSCWSTG